MLTPCATCLRICIYKIIIHYIYTRIIMHCVAALRCPNVKLHTLLFQVNSLGVLCAQIHYYTLNSLPSSFAHCSVLHAWGNYVQALYLHFHSRDPIQCKECVNNTLVSSIAEPMNSCLLTQSGIEFYCCFPFTTMCTT